MTLRFQQREQVTLTTVAVAECDYCHITADVAEADQYPQGWIRAETVGSGVGVLGFCGWPHASLYAAQQGPV